jgi:hypothetical protein
VAPFKKHLKTDAAPKRSNTQRYEEDKRKWMMEHVKTLAESVTLAGNPATLSRRYCAGAQNFR